MMRLLPNLVTHYDAQIVGWITKKRPGKELATPQKSIMIGDNLRIKLVASNRVLSTYDTCKTLCASSQVHNQLLYSM